MGSAVVQITASLKYLDYMEHIFLLPIDLLKMILFFCSMIFKPEFFIFYKFKKTTTKTTITNYEKKLEIKINSKSMIHRR
jgi:hypothetical protein